MGKKRCLYCGKLITNDKTYCDIQCKDNYNNFEQYASKRTKAFLISLSIAMIIIFLGIILMAARKEIGVIMSIIGGVGVFGTFIVLPFGTPETVKLLGVKKTTLIVRIVALVMLIWILVPFLKDAIF
ncbi:DUF2116 family Zn-ribbon domain-containing protein [Clostridium hydrogeniformans]|uniref:DUF2116 family Zn-ribbon domain-containing protein n=1 Tax=Clostridium hydrogeniformans TaxID=349933 RepID=UPI000481CBF7|nr:DUF2116 family Zn-ribbon domain-containing protein [Clostridium hydrogeniformans]